MSRSRAIYLVADWPWPPTSGGRQHSAGVADALTEIFDLTVLSPDGPRAPARWHEAASRMGARRADGLVRVADFARSLIAGRHVVLERAMRSGLPGAFEEQVRRIQPAAVIIGRPFFGRFVDIAFRAGALVVGDVDESSARVSASIVVHPGRRVARLRALVEYTALARMEAREYARFDQLWVVSEREKRHLKGIAREGRIRVVPNAVPRPIELPTDVRPVRGVAFVGWYGYPPNEAAALELIDDVMPRVRSLGGPDHLVLIGRDPTRAMVSAAKQNPMVTIRGEVADTGPDLTHAGLVVAPIRAGGGTKIKILEAAALGVPIVATHHAVAGLGLRHGRDVLLGRSPDDLARAAVRLTRDPDLRMQLIRNAAGLVAERWSAESTARAMRAAIADLL